MPITWSPFYKFSSLGIKKVMGKPTYDISHVLFLRACWVPTCCRQHPEVNCCFKVRWMSEDATKRRGGSSKAHKGAYDRYFTFYKTSLQECSPSFGHIGGPKGSAQWAIMSQTSQSELDVTQKGGFHSQCCM